MQDSANFPTPKGTIPRFEPGVYHDIDHEIYLASEGLSSSQIKTLVTKSPAHLKGEVHKTSQAMYEGTLFHDYMADPAGFESRYCPEYQRQDGDLVTADDIKAALEARGLKKTGKKDELIACLLEADPGARILDKVREREHGTRMPISVELWDQLHYMRDGVMRHSDARLILECVDPAVDKPESSAYWDDPETGIRCRIRPDLTVSQLAMIVDLKSTVSASRRDFGRQAADLDYLIQQVHYCAGWSIAADTRLDSLNPFVFIAVEKTPPYEAATYIMPAWALEIAADARLEAMYTYRTCLETDHWPGYQAVTVEAEIPVWYKSKFKQEIKA